MEDHRLPGYRRLARMLAPLLAGLAFGLAAPAVSAEPRAKFEYFLTGNAADASPDLARLPKSPTTVVMGGGPDVDDAFRWMIGKSGGGDFVVIRVRGEDGYNQYVYDMGGLDSVETIVLKNREAASDPFVLDKVRKAEALFIAGGDQSDYITLWKGTPLDAAIQDLVRRNVPIGGTSAGLAVLGEFDFSAMNGTVTSAEALADPYDRRVTLDRGFLTAPGLAGAIADAHLDSRDRMGRLLTFLARIVRDAWAAPDQARAIGLDVETALAIEGGVATVLGVGHAYFLKPLIGPTVCEPGSPLTFRNVSLTRLTGASTFDLERWRASGTGAAFYDISAESGVLVSSQPGGSVY